MSNVNASEFNVKYTGKEKAVVFITDDGSPFSTAIIGITYPFSDYSVYRSAENDQNVFEYILEGSGEVLLNGSWRSVQAGDMYILREGEPHFYRADPKTPWKKLWINYASDYISAFFTSYRVKSGIYRSETVRPYFDRLYGYTKLRSADRNTCFDIADGVHKIIEAAAINDGTPISDEYRIKEALNAAIYKKLSLDELSESLHISKSNIIRIFRSKYGSTPYEYLISLKITAAKALLKDTLMTVKEISERLQITDEHYFSTVFLKKVGMRPRAYRAAVTNSGSDKL